MLVRDYFRSIGLVSAMAGIVSAPASAECMLNVDVPEKRSSSYIERGDRCEGIYKRPVSASTKLILRGFHLEPPAYSLDAERLELQVINSPPAVEQAAMQVKSMRRRHYYQMDTDAIDPSGYFSWDTEILRHQDVRLEPENIAVLFCENRCRLDDKTRVWPVWVKEKRDASRAEQTLPYLILESEIELARIFLTIKHIPTGSYLYENKRLRSKNFPPDLPIVLPIKAEQPGDYAVTVKAVSREGLPDQLSFIAVLPPEVFSENGK